MYDYTENNTKKTRVYVYDNENLHIFNGSGNVLVAESVEPHNMGAIPIIQCLNNDDVFSDIQCILDLLDSLSLVISNNTDDLQSIANAILCASGGTLSKEQIDKIKISDTKIKKLIQSIEEKVEALSKEKNYDNQLKIIDSICKDRNKYLSYYWTSYIGYLKNIKELLKIIKK